MENCERIITTWFIFLFMIILSLQIFSVIGNGEQHIMQEKPSFAKIVKDALSKLKKSHISSWEKIKIIIHDIQLKFFPPNLDFRGADAEAKKRGARERVVEATEKSFEQSKTTAEESAKSAAKVVGEAIHKVKDKLSHDDEEDSHRRQEL